MKAFKSVEFYMKKIIVLTMILSFLSALPFTALGSQNITENFVAYIPVAASMPRAISNRRIEVNVVTESSYVVTMGVISPLMLT